MFDLKIFIAQFLFFVLITAPFAMLCAKVSKKRERNDMYIAWLIIISLVVIFLNLLK